MLAPKTTSSLNPNVPSTMSLPSKGQLEFKYVPERLRYQICALLNMLLKDAL